MISNNINLDFMPRPYQTNAVQALLNYDKAIMHSPTGSGKTNIMAYLIAQLRLKTLVIVPAIDLINQTKDRFKAILDTDVTIGTIGGGYSNNNRQKEIEKDILITTWQSLGSKNSVLPQLKGNFDMIIVDECHHASANVLFSVINYLSPSVRKLYGVSATPYRSSQDDERKLMALFGNNLAYKVEIDDLYKDGFLVRPSVDIIKIGNYSLENLAIENYIKKFLGKKFDENISENGSYSDFVENISKIGYAVVSGITKESGFKMLELSKTTSNGNEKPLDNYDVTNIRRYVKNLFDNIENENTKKILLCQNIIKMLRFGVNDNILKNMTSSEVGEKQEEMLYNFSQFFKIFAISILSKNPKMLPYNWDDIGMKIGYLKKGIDEDFIRQQEIEKLLKKIFLDKQKNSIDIKSIVLTNSISWGKKLLDDFQKNPLLKNIELFYINGQSKDKQYIFDSVRQIPQDKNFILISTTSLIKEGIDLPSVNSVYQLSPVFNPINAIYSTEQLIGRAIRPYKNKTKAEIMIFDAFTTDFSSRRNEIFSTILENVKPDSFNFYDGMNNYIKQKSYNIIHINNNNIYYNSDDNNEKLNKGKRIKQ